MTDKELLELEEALKTAREREERLAREEQRLKELKVKTAEEQEKLRREIERLQQEKEKLLIIQNLILQHVREKRLREEQEIENVQNEPKMDADAFKYLKKLMEEEKKRKLKKEASKAKKESIAKKTLTKDITLETPTPRR
jgi:hypothetical protein